MPLPESIIRDLRKGQSTADSVALRMGVPKEHVEAILARFVKEGSCTAHAIYGLDAVSAYRLTPKALQQISDKQTN